MVADLVLNLLPLFLAHPPELHRISGHAQGEALLEAAILATIAVDAIHDTVLLTRALVVDHGGLGPSEEALASLAGDDAIVDPGGLVPAHLARDDLDLRFDGVGLLLSGRWAVGGRGRGGGRGGGVHGVARHLPLPPRPEELAKNIHLR